MTRNAFFILLTLLCYTKVYAQYNTNENKVWVFGYNAGVSFATGSPIPFASSMMADEGCASVCDAAGNLLFYTNGKKVWNSAHVVMPSGSNIIPYSTMSCTQAALIVPMPGMAGKYYVLSLGSEMYSGPNDHLVYSIVDMSLDGGMGDVDTTTYTELLDSLSEKMVTIRGADCKVWLVTRSQNGTIFYTFQISTSGISGPIISPCGFTLFPAYTAYMAGVIKSSPDGNLLVSQSQSISLNGWTELFRFNGSTGALTSIGVLDSSGFNHGAEFSPDNTKLYTWRNIYSSPISITSERQICQYDVSLPTVEAIRASRTTITTFPSTDAGRKELKLAADNKIYVAHLNSHFIDCIPNPNIGGTGCGYITNAVDLGAGICKSGLPNIITSPLVDINTTSEFVSGCAIGSAGYSLHAPITGSGIHYTWYDGSTLPVHYITSSGTYWVYIHEGCNLTIDTFHVTLETLPDVNLGNDTTINEGSTLILSAPVPSGSSCVWSTGSSTDTIHVSSAGTYWVIVHGESCSTMDTINIKTGIPTVIYTSTHITKSIFPNPAAGNIFISVSGLSGNTATISCYNAIGAQVITQNTALQNGVLNTSTYVGSLPTGLYEIRIEDETGRKITERITVNR